MVDEPVRIIGQIDLFDNKAALSEESQWSLYKPSDSPPREVDYSECEGCPLRGNTRVWRWRGSYDSPLCFIGMNPGAQEKKHGYPFVGRAGVKLEEEVLERLGVRGGQLLRTKYGEFSLDGDFYLTNVVKSYTSNNADPTAKAVKHCWNHLFPELKGRKIIVMMGRLAQNAVKLRYNGDAILFDMIHPSAANYKGSYLARLIDDAKRLKNIIEEVI